MAIKCRKIHTKLLLLIGVFVVLTFTLNYISQYQIRQKNDILFHLPHLSSALFQNHSTTVLTQNREPVQIWKPHNHSTKLLTRTREPVQIWKPHNHDTRVLTRNREPVQKWKPHNHSTTVLTRNREPVQIWKPQNHATPVLTRNRESIQIWQPHPSDDRILAQAEFLPNVDFTSLPPKRILLAQGLSGWGVQKGNKAFVENKCPVQNCNLLEHPSSGEIIDARLFKEIELNENMYPQALSVVPRHPDQVWIMFGLESPEASPSYANLNDVINWTATYRYDSTMVTPYDKFKTYDNFTTISDYKPIKNYAASKTKMAAIFTSNCDASNNRLDIVKALQQFINVDFYGKCGTLTCERENEKSCFQKLTNEYKFYLSFENANCRDYITEKLFLNALRHDVVPVVMGAHPDDYRRVAPPGSYIHVEDFRSVQELANNLKFLDKNDDEYNKFFRWKQTGSFIDTKFWCRICSMLWYPDKPRISVPDLDKWWRGKGVCIGKRRWDDVGKQNLTSISDPTA